MLTGLTVLITGFLVSIGTTMVLVPVVRDLALRYGWVDLPDSVRKLHARPIPPVGGVAIALGFGVGLLYVLFLEDYLPFELPQVSIPVLFGLAAMVAVGLYDDVRGLDFKSKFAVQIVVAYSLIYAGFKVDVSHLPFVSEDPYHQALLTIPITLLWIVGVINAVNLLDGLDGLAGGVMVIAFACLAAIFGLHGEGGLVVFAVLIAGALLGFLVFNFNPASIFMGDSGSLFLGCLIAVYSLSGPPSGDKLVGALVPAVVLGLPLIDTTLSIFRRLAARRAIFAPDQDHIHHRLSRRWNTRGAVLTLYAAAIWFGTSAILMSLLTPAFGIAVLTLTLIGAISAIVLLGYLGTERNARISYAHRAPEARLLIGFDSHDGDGHSGSEAVEVSQPVPHEFEPPVNAHREEWKWNRRLAVEERALQKAADRRIRLSVRNRKIQQKARQDAPSASHYQTHAVLTTDRALKMIMPSSIVVVANGLTSANLGGEAVVLDSKAGRYYGLNEVGARILELAGEATTVEEIIASMSRDYDVDEARLKRDVIEFVEEMERQQLVRVTD